jgi:tripartite-type tricarboxylate transporter receptor subunit TctC
MRTGWLLGGLAAVTAWVSSVAPADAAYPVDHPVIIVVGYGAGGGTDLVARAIQPDLSKALGTSVVIANKPGAGGSVGAQFVSRANPDGYTLLLSSASSVTITPLLNPEVGYTQANFAPIAQLTIAPLVIAVNKNLGVHSLKELVALAKANPGKLNYASSGTGSGPHLAGVLFGDVAGVQMTHIPFKSGAPATMSVISGETQATFATTPSVMPAVRSGQLIGLAVSTKADSPLVPELPGSVKAGLPDYEIFQWNGLFAPAGTPQAVIDTIFKATQIALQSPQVRKILADEGTDVAVSPSPANFSGFLQKDNVFWAKLVKESGIKSLN